MAAIAGCGAPSARPEAPHVAPAARAADFPEPAALAAITAGPVPSPRLEAGDLPAQGWTIELATASASPAHTAWQPTSDWDRAAINALTSAGRSPRMTEAMACVAREMARWTLGHDKPPPAGLRRFMLGACGAVATDFDAQILGGEVPADAADDVIFERWGGQVPQLVAGLPAGATDAGFAFARDGNHAVVLLTHASVRAELEPFSLHASDAGELSLSGTLREPVDVITGHVNRGPHGVAPCDVDPAVPRPRFRVTCRVAGADESAWIELVSAPPRRVLATSFARVLARRPGTNRLSYRPSTDEGETSAISTEQFAERAVGALNEVRARAGLSPVRLSAAESAMATRIAPYYFNAALGHDSPALLDTIALGLLAGWDVGGMIRDGRFISTFVPRTHDPVRWLEETLELPSGRSALLEGAIEEVALGPVLLGEPMAIGAVAVGYRFHHDIDHDDDVERLHVRAKVARRLRSLPEPERLPGMAEVMRAELEEVHLGKAEPRAALDRVLEAAATRLRVGVRGFVVEATSLDALELPEELVMQPRLRLEIGVTHRKPQGAPWAQLVILVVFEDSGAGAGR